MDYLLSTDALTKQYGSCKAVDGVSMHVRRGGIYGLIGQNGAGKTTLMKMISGLAIPTSGSFSLFGQPCDGSSPRMSRVGLLIEHPGFYAGMSAEENMKLKCIALGVRHKETVGRLLETVGLSDTGKKPVRSFSLGMKQRLGIALALVGNPDLLILDEPINGLDPQGIAEVREMLLRLNREQNITLIISSHILEELSKIATEYGIIHKGVLVRELSREQLLSECSDRIELKTDDTSRACTALEGLGITCYKVVDPDTIHIFDLTADCGNITMTLAQNGVKTSSVFVKNGTLEDYFISLTGGIANA